MTIFYTLMTRGSLGRNNKYHLNKENLQWSTRDFAPVKGPLPRVTSATMYNRNII